MAQSATNHVVWILVFMLAVAIAGATPPGIAKGVATAKCMNEKFKTCNNLVHVCPKFCPDGCYVHCRSCKPICNGTEPPPDFETDPESRYPPPLPATAPSPPPPTITLSPPPPTITPSPPPPIIIPSPPPTITLSPPPPPTITPSPPPPPTTTPSPPPSTSTPSPPSPTTTPSPPPPTTTTTPSTPPSTPPTTTPSPPPSTPPPTTTPSTPPSTPPTTTPSPPPSTPPPTTTPSPPPSIPSSPIATPSPPPSIPSPPPTSTPSPSPPTTTPSPPPPTTTPSPSPPPPTPTPSPSPPPPTPSSHSPPQTPTPSTSPMKARCKNKHYPLCYYAREQACPAACTGGCDVDCVSCKPVCNCDKPGSVCQDPRFIGGDGITFYFHGKKDQDFCLVSDTNLHINGHFIGKRNKYMKRDFTWVQSIGILFTNHKLVISAQKTSSWDNSVDRLTITLDQNTIIIPETEGAKWQSQTLPKTTISRTSDTNNVVIEVEGLFQITAKVVPITEEESRVHNYGITSDDCFAHLDLGFKFFSLSDEVNGILGQTYRSEYVSQVNTDAAMPVMGGEKKFSSSSLFATDCSVASFKDRHGYGTEASLLNLELPSLSCQSGFGGQAGVICKR